jgi:hypothetical protein
MVEAGGGGDNNGNVIEVKALVVPCQRIFMTSNPKYFDLWQDLILFSFCYLTIELEQKLLQKHPVDEAMCRQRRINL